MRTGRKRCPRSHFSVGPNFLQCRILTFTRLVRHDKGGVTVEETSMANPKYRDWILETIDQLRKRKARPDLERICHMVERKHGLSSRETEAQLEKLVDSEIVIKVDYKGNTSYRNGAKWKKSHLGGVVLNSSTASKRLHDAITELSHSQPTQNQETERFGISIRDIKNWLQSNFDDEVPLKSPINIVLQREIDAGRIEKLQNGNFSLPSSGHKVTRPKTLDVKQIAGTPSRRGRPPKNKNLGFKKVGSTYNF